MSDQYPTDPHAADPTRVYGQQPEPAYDPELDE